MTSKTHQNFISKVTKKGSIRFFGAMTILLIVLSALAACGGTPAAIPEAVEPVVEQGEDPQPDAGENLIYEGKKILWIDSYHQGYEWSDSIEAGLRSVLEGTGVDFQLFRMDTKNITDDAGRQRVAQQAYAQIQSMNPDVVIVCDDNAQQYLVVPYLKDTATPVIFCGVNWDASGYGYPASNVTGMVEVEFPIEMIEKLSFFAQGNRIGYMSGDTTTEQKVAEIYNERFFEGQMLIDLVLTFDEFKAAFVQMQSEVDILFIRNNAGIKGWDDAEAEAFVLANSVIPSGSPQVWMAPYVLMVIGELGEEQGIWSAEMALKVLDGDPISSIPMTENQVGQLILNFEIAEQIDVEFPPAMLRDADIYGLEGASN